MIRLANVRYRKKKRKGTGKKKKNVASIAHCTCPSGYAGIRCERCQHGYSQYPLCKLIAKKSCKIPCNNGYCDTIHGICRCNSGYKPPQCLTVVSSPPIKSGIQDEKKKHRVRSTRWKNKT